MQHHLPQEQRRQGLPVESGEGRPAGGLLAGSHAWQPLQLHRTWPRSLDEGCQEQDLPRWLLIVCYWLLVAGCYLLVACCLLLVAGCLLLVAGCLLLVACCWLLVACCWLLVAGCLLLVVFLLFAQNHKTTTDCDLVALLEDDTGMELLVSNKIISLDLAVKDVYKRIWLADHSDTEAMRIVYRMRGLLGDATEDMVNSLETRKDSDVDCEEVYRMASVMGECNGLKVMLDRLAMIRNLVTGKQLMVVLLKLFTYCLKLKSNKQQLLRVDMQCITKMLGALNLALLAEQENSVSTKGQTLTEQLLQIMEVILLEASTHQPLDVYKQFSKCCGDKDQLMMLLDRINSPFVRSNPSVLQALMRLIPFLAYGDDDKMMALINHFKPYMHFERSSILFLFFFFFLIFFLFFFSFFFLPF